MEKNQFKILFLDDEVYDPDSPAALAKEALEDEGFMVEATDRMSRVISLSRKNYYHLYLLDIDMGKVQDDFDGNGATVGEVLRRRSSLRHVIVYSARGTVEDWFTAANYHFHAYIHKDGREWGEEKLLSTVKNLFETIESRPDEIPMLATRDHSDTVLLYNEDKRLPDDFMDVRFKHRIKVETLSQIPALCRENNPGLVLVVMPHPPKDLSGRRDFEQNIREALSVQPGPNVIVCTGASKEDKQLLKIINARPFRMINLDSPAFETEFDKAVESARLWYGEEEVFDFPDPDQAQAVPMTKEEIDALRPDGLDESDWETIEEETDD